MTPSQIREFNQALDTLKTHFDGSYERARAFLETPHPAIKDLAPIEMIRSGRGHKLLRWMKSELERKKS
jgi:uncharacterized protein (DUF2384 family)